MPVSTQQKLFIGGGVLLLTAAAVTGGIYFKNRDSSSISNQNNTSLPATSTSGQTPKNVKEGSTLGNPEEKELEGKGKKNNLEVAENNLPTPEEREREHQARLQEIEAQKKKKLQEEEARYQASRARLEAHFKHQEEAFDDFQRLGEQINQPKQQLAEDTEDEAIDAQLGQNKAEFNSKMSKINSETNALLQLSKLKTDKLQHMKELWDACMKLENAKLAEKASQTQDTKESQKLLGMMNNIPELNELLKTYRSKVNDAKSVEEVEAFVAEFEQKLRDYN